MTYFVHSRRLVFGLILALCAGAVPAFAAAPAPAGQPATVRLDYIHSLSLIHI